MSDAVACTMRFYANIPLRTHRIVCNGEVIGHWWSDGSITLDESTMPGEVKSPRELRGDGL